MKPLNRVSVIGAGAWGTALAGVAVRAGREVTLYARDAAMAAAISATRDNPRLPGIPLDRSIVVTHDIAAAGRADIVVIAVPAQNSRTAVAALAPHLAARDARRSPAPRASSMARARFMTEVVKKPRLKPFPRSCPDRVLPTTWRAGCRQR